MACGVPVAATDVGDAGRIVGEFGEVVPPRQPELLCAGWARLRQRLAQDARFRDAMRHSIVTNYGVHMMVERTAHVLALLMASRSPEEITRDLA